MLTVFNSVCETKAIIVAIGKEASKLIFKAILVFKILSLSKKSRKNSFLFLVKNLSVELKNDDNEFNMAVLNEGRKDQKDFLHLQTDKLHLKKNLKKNE